LSNPQLTELRQKDELLTAIRAPIESDDERRRCERSLLAYTHAGWRWAGEPGRFVDNWHIECMCEHLEAVANRQILRLLINVPPRHYKSMGLNVFFPSGVWAQNPYPDEDHPHRAIREETWMGPGVRFAYLSYDAELSTEHSIKCRELIESPWYQNHWGGRFQLTQNLKTHYNNDKGGQRKSGTLHGMTGFGANIFGYDDPHDLQNVGCAVTPIHTSSRRASRIMTRT
jgi:hypothetical protein